jgi:hypothetical protein
MRNHVISLYDYTGDALRPWAEAGYECFAYDIQHDNSTPTDYGINYIHADLYDPQTLLDILATHCSKAFFMSAFPPCTDLSSAGARWWKDKEKEDPYFQITATRHVTNCDHLGKALNVPYYIENPVGALSRIWRKADFTFNPYEYGGYLPKDDTHPDWPDVIPPRDAYRKRTCLWTGGYFNMPDTRPVDPVNVVLNRKDPKKGKNFSPIHAKTGGKSLKTKNIRSATPRGFAKAVFLANADFSWVGTGRDVQGGVRDYGKGVVVDFKTLKQWEGSCFK